MAKLNWGQIRDAIKTSAIQTLGDKATIRRKQRGTNEPIPGVLVTRGTHELATSAEFDAVLGSEVRLFENGMSITNGNRTLVLSPGPFVPEVGDTAEMNGVTMEILKVKSVRPDGQTDVVHQCEVAI